MKGIRGTSNETYRKIMGNGLRYVIPKFQRDYSWGTEQWDDLWQDISLILTDEEEEHYMGYLVLQTTDNKVYKVIDGQQRLTTLSILILSVLKLLTKFAESKEDEADNLRRILAYRDSYIGTLNTITLVSDTKLSLNRNSNDYYKNNLVLLKDLPLRNTNASEKQMRECFLWFFSKLNSNFSNGSELATFVELIVDKLFFTVITVTDQINAFKVFETLNARGVQLSSSDLLKNYLFSVVDVSGTSKSDIEQLEILWSRIVGKLGKIKFEDYLRYYWNSKHKTVRKNQLFKTIRSGIKDKKSAFALVRELDDTADLFMAIQDPDSEYWSNQEDVKIHLRELKLFGIRQANSLLIAGHKELESKKFLKLLKTIAVVSFRYNVIGGLNPNEQEDVYNKMAINISKHSSFDISLLQPVYVGDRAFQMSFSAKTLKSTSRNHKIAKYILSKIERFEFGNDIPIDSDVYTIEHILPESADESWGQFSDEELVRSIYRLGNLTLLESKLNKKASVKSYEEKKKIFEESNCQLTNRIPEEFDTWTEGKIIARQKQMSKHAKSIWVVQDLG